jgi:hypothetical protein
MELFDFMPALSDLKLHQDSALAKTIAEGKQSAYKWHPVEYEIVQDGVFVNERKAPFNGDPVLIVTTSGIIEASWNGVTGFGENAEGFYWKDIAGDDYELEAVGAWHPVPDSPRPLSELSSCDAYLQEKGVLIQTKEKEWVEAWFDREYDVWQAMDADFIVKKEDVIGWVPLPETENLSLFLATDCLTTINEHPATQKLREIFELPGISQTAIESFSRALLTNYPDLNTLFESFQSRMERVLYEKEKDDPELNSIDEGINKLPGMFRSIALEKSGLTAQNSIAIKP